MAESITVVPVGRACTFAMAPSNGVVAFNPDTTLSSLKDRICAALGLQEELKPALCLTSVQHLESIGGEDSDSVICLLDVPLTGTYLGSGCRFKYQVMESSSELFVDTLPNGQVELLQMSSTERDLPEDESATCAALRFTSTTELSASLDVAKIPKHLLTGTMLTLRFRAQNGQEVTVLTDPSDTIRSVFATVRVKLGMGGIDCRLLFDGMCIFGTCRGGGDRPLSELDFEDGDTIDVACEQMGGMMHSTSGRLNYAELASLRQCVVLRSLNGKTLQTVDVTGGTSVFDLKKAATVALAEAAADEEIDEMSEAEAKHLLKELRRRQQAGTSSAFDEAVAEPKPKAPRRSPRRGAA
jgi:hypothetical protein